MKEWTREFIELARSAGALKLGRFELKSGRMSPYFFNAGAFCDGRHIASVADCYADAIVAAMTDSGLEFDLVFGPAYKGIPLATSVAISLYRRHGINVPVAYDRKEAKDHGEGGTIVGAPLQGKVLIIDDVITAGTAIRESMAIIESAGATPAGVLIALDRQERGQGELSAIQEVEQNYGIPVISIIRLEQVLEYIQGQPALSAHAENIAAYRAKYGV